MAVNFSYNKLLLHGIIYCNMESVTAIYSQYMVLVTATYSQYMVSLSVVYYQYMMSVTVT